MSKRALLLNGMAVLCFASVTMGARWWQVSAEPPPTPETLVRHVRQALGRGQVAQARTLAATVTAPPEVTAVATALVDLFENKNTEARARLTPLVDGGAVGDALLELGLLDIREGKRQEGRARLTALIQQSFDMTPENTLRMARAAWALGDVRLTNSLFQRISQIPLQLAEKEATWGDMFWVNHEYAEALRSYRLALEADPGWIPAHLGLVRTIPELVDMDPAEAKAALETARKLAPNHPDVWILTAVEALTQEDKPGTAAALDKVAEARPGTAEEAAFRAALAYLDGRATDVETWMARALEIDRFFGRGYRILGDEAERLYRFDDAVAFATRATEIDPDDPDNFAALGMYQMRIGDEAAARQSLERSFKMAPFNRETLNLLRNLDIVDTFDTVEHGPFIFRFASGDTEILKAYALPLADLAYDTFSKRYGITPRGPILVEVFDKHDDFAVRTIGYGGIEGALGACFGRVIAMDSPKARDPGTFSWQATLWHEIAHVFSLQASDYRVPRWLTEGISVFEEHRYNPAWGRELIVTYARALAEERTFGVKGLPDAFKRPHDLALAYFEASLLTEHLVAQHGDEGLRRLLAAYAGGAKDVEAFAQAFSQTVEDVEASFKTFVDNGYGALAAAMASPGPESEGSRLSLDERRALVAKAPGSYLAQWGLGAALIDAGDMDGAVQALERAATLVPMGSGNDSPRAMLAGIAEQQGDSAKARRELRELLRWDHDNVVAARRLVALARQAGDTENEDFGLRVVADIDPYDVDAHVLLGRRALAKKAYEDALVELEAVIALGPVNRAEAHADLAEAYLGLNRKDEAKAEALKALEQAPTFARAQDILLAAIRRQ